MNTVLELAGVALAALLSENLVLVSCMGIGTHEKSFQDPREAIRTGLCLTLVMVLGALGAWLLNFLILLRFNLAYFQVLAFALLIPGLVAGVRKLFQACIPELSRRVDGNLSSISTNCAALGSALLISQRSYGLDSALIFALCGGIGATLALASFASLQKEVDLNRCPKAFRGVPIQLITAGLMAMALLGYYGLYLG
ncbi:MAG: electron transport complex subunit RsxA [Lawsonibacter sp.]|jgi:electron transport complex protein RnfA|uniref:Rnf-Nqr domain containing protein n=1 Tax=Lawsonibacter sp. JLR.KK007 TaxID=3114293 RepID=UPI002170AC71|nr:electron transport complex subunit RsxA [Lawsonibacter sp.]MCI8989947.1 electron transport complex subunit RsxA [Lawsonibacter sp.]MCI9268085.1 electron transport complex subunit RsxA [Lawsonibacter sp.]